MYRVFIQYSNGIKEVKEENIMSFEKAKEKRDDIKEDSDLSCVADFVVQKTR